MKIIEGVIRVPKINKEDFKGTLAIVGKVDKKDLKINDDGNIEVTLRVKYSRTTIFIYETAPIMVKRLQKYNEDDVVQISGEFVAEWFPKKKTPTLPVINKVISAKKLGTLKS